MRWEDGLLTYLRSHGRARSWSEKQRRQNLWTKKGYDLAYRACACLCNRGHLRKDVHWNPQDIAVQFDGGKANNADEGAKKKNRKKHKDLPALGNKYSSNNVRSKSKPIPNNKDGRTRTSSSSSAMSVDQGYSSSSPANTEIYGAPMPAIFSPPHAVRQFLASAPPSQSHSSSRNGPMHGAMNSFINHPTLAEIPDNDILQDFRGRATSFSSSSPGAIMSPSLSPDEPDPAQQRRDPMGGVHGLLPPRRGLLSTDSVPVPPVWPSPFPPASQPTHLGDQRLAEISKMMETMGISKRVRTTSCGEFGDPRSPSSVSSQRMRSISESIVDSVSALDEPTSLMHHMFDFEQHATDHSLEPFGHFNPALIQNGQRNHNFGNANSLTNLLNPQAFANLPSQPQPFSPLANFPYEYLNELKKRGTHSYCPPDNQPNPALDLYLTQSLQENSIHQSDLNQGQVPLQPPHMLPENQISMIYNNMDIEKPQVIIIPGEKNAMNRRAFTEIRIIPMLTTTLSLIHI